jgi:hypothetical protein
MSVILPILTEFNDKGVKSATASLKSLAKTYATTAIASGAVTKGLMQVVKDASALNETVSKAGVIFGDSASQIEAFAKTAADTFGQSKQQALDAASTFATFGKAAGLSDNELVDFSTSLTKLSSDFASFFNTSPEDAITAIGAALRGESEPIRRYGVLLNDAALKQRAMAMGIYDGEGALSAQQKTLAAYSEILAQSTDAQGDFERTSEGMANKSRTLTANLKDLSAEIGQSLLPVVEDYTAAAVKFVDQMQGQAEESSKVEKVSESLGAKIVKLVSGFGTLERAVKLVNGQVRDYAEETDKARTATEQWADAMIAIEKGDLRAQTKAAQSERRRAYEANKKAEADAEAAAKRRAAAEKEAAAAAKRRREEAKRAAAAERQALKDLAATINGDLRQATQAAYDRFVDLMQESRQFAEGLRDQITGFVSLSDAVRTAGQSEETYNEALRERADAYAELNALQAERKRRGFSDSDQITYDANEYAAALRRVQEAEQGVNRAQAQRTNYVQEFAKQISDAREFANNLKALSARGLGLAGVQQLLSVGPLAGNAIARELLAGTGALSIGGLNQSLADIASAGFGFGQTVAAPLFDPAIGQAYADSLRLGYQTSAGVVNNQVVINVSGGDPQAVVDALKRYMNQNGSIPIRVSG